MSKNRQRPLHDPRGPSSLRFASLAYDYRPGHVVPRHYHDHDQLIYACAGVMTVRTDRGSWVVPPQRAIWLPARVAHAIEMTGPVSMRTLYFAPGRVRGPRRDCRVIAVSPLLRELVLHVVVLGPQVTPGRERLIRVIVDQLAELQAPPLPLDLPWPTEPRAVRLAELLRAQPGSARLERLYRQAGASRRTLERLFAVETGLTLGRWRQQLRLLEALRLLAAGQPVTSVALDLGYDSPSAFIVMFRRQLGTTPARYFRQMRTPATVTSSRS
jgi:AraC-like DNA-binding protein